MLFDFIWSFEYSAGLDIYFFYPRQVTTIFTCLNINLACPKSFNSEESKVVFFILVFVICFFCFTFLIIFAPYFVRSMTLSITQMESRMIITKRYFEFLFYIYIYIGITFPTMWQKITFPVDRYWQYLRVIIIFCTASKQALMSSPARMTYHCIDPHLSWWNILRTLLIIDC